MKIEWILCPFAVADNIFYNLCLYVYQVKQESVFSQLIPIGGEQHGRNHSSTNF